MKSQWIQYDNTIISLASHFVSVIECFPKDIDSSEQKNTVLWELKSLANNFCCRNSIEPFDLTTSIVQGTITASLSFFNEKDAKVVESGINKKSFTLGRESLRMKVTLIAPPSRTQAPKRNQLTLSVQGLPFKWFQIETRSSANNDIYKASDTVNQTFNQFGTVSNLEIVKSATRVDKKIKFKGLRFDVYVKFEDQKGFDNAINAFQSQSVICSSSSKLVLPLFLSFDCQNYFDEAIVRKRRFAREAHAAELEKEKNRKETRETEFLEILKTFDEFKGRFATVYAAVEDYPELRKSLKSLIQDCKKQESESLPRNCPNATEFCALLRRVRLFKEDVSLIERKIREFEDEEEKASVRERIAAWSQRIEDFKSSCVDRVNDHSAKFKELTTDDSLSSHVAVVAEVRSVLKMIETIKEVMGQVSVTKETTDEDLQSYAKKLDDELDELGYEVVELEKRLSVVQKIQKVEILIEKVKAADSTSDIARAVEKQEESCSAKLESFWVASTAELESGVDLLHDLLSLKTKVFDAEVEANKMSSRIKILEDQCNEREKETLDAELGEGRDAFNSLRNFLLKLDIDSYELHKSQCNRSITRLEKAFGDCKRNMQRNGIDTNGFKATPFESELKSFWSSISKKKANIRKWQSEMDKLSDMDLGSSKRKFSILSRVVDPNASVMVNTQAEEERLRDIVIESQLRKAALNAMKKSKFHSAMKTEG